MAGLAPIYGCVLLDARARGHSRTLAQAPVCSPGMGLPLLDAQIAESLQEA